MKITFPDKTELFDLSSYTENGEECFIYNSNPNLAFPDEFETIIISIGINKCCNIKQIGPPINYKYPVYSYPNMTITDFPIDLFMKYTLYLIKNPLPKV